MHPQIRYGPQQQARHSTWRHTSVRGSSLTAFTVRCVRCLWHRHLQDGSGSTCCPGCMLGTSLAGKGHRA